MSDTKDQLVHQLDCDSDTMLDINSDIIDISVLNFSDHETWLQPPIQDPLEYRVHDLRAWLKADLEYDSHDPRCSNGSKRSIDTRTFTRPKKRSGRLSFESILETAPSPSSNIWKSQDPSTLVAKQDDQDDTETTRQRRESTPPMLRPTNPGVSGLCSADTSLTSGQESLEAFLNMSQSTGIDSFINLAEPEFSDALMNVSQPSVLYSTMLSTTRDDLSQTVVQSGIEDSQILTESMMQTSMFGETADVNFNDTFLKNNITVLENTSFSTSPNDRTFINETATIFNEKLESTFSTPVPSSGTLETMNATYTPSELHSTLRNDISHDPHASYIVNQTCQTPDLKNVVNDASFVIKTQVVNRRTFGVITETPDIAKNALSSNSDVSKAERGNETFDINNFDATFDKVSPRKSSTNSTFKVPDLAINNATVVTNVTGVTNAILKAPTATNLDTTYDQTSKKDCCNDVPITNRYNTYRKASAPERMKNENYPTNNTITKLSMKSDIGSRGASLENFDETFNKPAPKIVRKLNAPRALSRLPQSLQKSNPNLVSNSLKTVNAVTRSGIPSYGENKIARPNTTRNVESSLTSKLYALAKIKSGSEQRLEATRNPSEFQAKAASGSTESIDSTQSAHSAPDFDDRLSVCSDSSNTSFSVRTMNIEELRNIVRMQEESLKQESTPKPKRRVLENTWVAASKDLPSPILKISPEVYGSRGSSPRSTDSTVKTSSPLLSPTESLQNLTINVAVPNKDNQKQENKIISPRNDNIVVTKISETSVKPTRTAGENRTGLRQPANWTSVNRPASGIPRPASRIPAPRLVRPNAKNNQGDIKKGL